MNAFDILSYLSLAAGIGAGALAYENDFIQDFISEYGFMGHFLAVFIGMCGACLVFVIGLLLLGLF